MVARKRAETGSTMVKRAAEAGKTGNHRHQHVEFRVSKRCEVVLTAALRGLNAAQQARVVDAFRTIARDAREQGERFVEKNVVGNANELLAAMTHRYAAENRWPELRALWTFLAHLDVPVNHERIARQLEKALGKEAAKTYRETATEG